MNICNNERMNEKENQEKCIEMGRKTNKHKQKS